MTFDLDSYVVLWSPSQKMFQKETVREMLEDNKTAYLHQSRVDYIVLGFTKTNEEANDAIAKFQKDRDLRAQ